MHTQRDHYTGMSNMEILSPDNCPVLIIDDFYDDDQQEDIWCELDYYNRVDRWSNDPNDPHRSRGWDGKPLVENSRIYLDNIFTAQGRNMSFILSHHNKIYEKDIMVPYGNMSAAARTISRVTQNTSFLSYYSHNDAYAPHMDNALHSAMVYFYKEPKSFVGGDLEFEDNGVTVECKHNRMVMFPSFYRHSSTPLISKEATPTKWMGKYTMSHFLHRACPHNPADER